MSLSSSTTSIRFLPGLVLLVVELNAATVGRVFSLMPLPIKILLNTELYVIPRYLSGIGTIYLLTDYSSLTLHTLRRVGFINKVQYLVRASFLLYPTTGDRNSSPQSPDSHHSFGHKMAFVHSLHKLFGSVPQLGSSSEATSFVNLVCLLPSEFIT